VVPNGPWPIDPQMKRCVAENQSEKRCQLDLDGLAPSHRSQCLVCQDQERHCHDVSFLRLQGLNVCDSFYFFKILSNFDLKNMISTYAKDFPLKNDPLPDFQKKTFQIIRFL
jgi:hypothetical protein